MELPVALQGQEFALAAALGLVLGLVYDILGGFRRIWRPCTWLMDLLFSGVLLYSMVWFLLVPGRGLFRLYHGVGLVLGAALWLLAPGPRFSRLWTRALRGIFAGIALIFSPVTKFLKKLLNLQKNSFQSPENGVK